MWTGDGTRRLCECGHWTSIQRAKMCWQFIVHLICVSWWCPSCEKTEKNFLLHSLDFVCFPFFLFFKIQELWQNPRHADIPCNQFNSMRCFAVVHNGVPNVYWQVSQLVGRVVSDGGCWKRNSVIFKTLSDLQESVVCQRENWTRRWIYKCISPRGGGATKEMIFLCGRILYSGVVIWPTARFSSLPECWARVKNSSIFMRHDSKFRTPIQWMVMVCAFACWFLFDFYILFSVVR